MFPGNPLLWLAGLSGLPAPPEGTPLADASVDAPGMVRAAAPPSSFGPIAAAQAVRVASSPEGEAPHKSGIGHAIGGAIEKMLGISHANNVASMKRNDELGRLFLAEAMKPGAPPEALDAALGFGKKGGWDAGAMSKAKQAYQMVAEAEAAHNDYIRKMELLNQSQKPALGQTPPQPMPQAALSSPFLQGQQPPPQQEPQVPEMLRPPAPNFQNTAAMQNAMGSRQLPPPPIPFSQGAVQASPTPTPANLVEGRASGGASAGAGFGGASTAAASGSLPEVPDPAMRPTLFHYGPAAQGRIALAAGAPLERFKTDEHVRQAGAIAQQALQQHIQESERILAEMEKDPGFQRLPELQKQEMRLRVRGVQGAISNLARPMTSSKTVLGADILKQNPDAKDGFGNPVDPKVNYFMREYPGSDTPREFLPSSSGSKEHLVFDESSPSGFARITADSAGREISRETNAIPPTSQNVRVYRGKKYLQTADGWMEIPYEAFSGPAKNMGQGAGGAAAGGPPPAKMTPPPGGATNQPAQGQSNAATNITANNLPPGARIIAPTLAAKKWEEELEEYNEKGKASMQELRPRMEMMERLMEQLKPYQKSKMPMSSLLDVIAYKLGYDKGWGEFISQLNLSGMQQAATLMRGIGKGKALLDEMQFHVANANKDSGELMYNKMKGIYKNMQDMRGAVNTYGRKRVKVDGGDGQNSGITPPPMVIDLPGGKQVVIK